MAHLSDLAHQRQTLTEQLLSGLVCTVLETQPGSYAHDAGLEWSLASIDWHRFADVNPSSIDALYQSLGNRFNRHAQLSKQAMLARLVEALQRQQLHSDAPEAHYSLLSAIIHLSRMPLQDDYVPSAAALACLQAGATDDGLEDGGSEASALSHWEEPEDDSASLSLSEWEGSASEADSLEQIPSPQQEPEPADSPSAGKRRTLTDMLRLGQLDTTSKPERLHTPASEVHGIQDGCLLQRVLSAQAGDASPQMPSSTLCFTERELVVQVLHMLRGCPSPGSAFRLDAKADAFEVAPGVHVPHLSPTCLRNVLLSWVKTGTTAYRLRIFTAAVNAAATASSRDGVKSPIAASATLAAYATGFASELASVESQAIRLQERFAAGPCRGRLEASDANLAALGVAAQGIVRQIEKLECVAGGIDIAGKRQTQAAEQSMSVLNGLHKLLVSAAEDATPDGRASAAVVMRLLLRALRPTLYGLELWIQQGRLEDHLDELMVCKGEEGIEVDNPGFWQSACHLRRDQSGSLLCPQFLQAAAEDILAAGKASLLLEAKQRYGRDASPAVCDGPALHADMLRRLECWVGDPEPESTGSLQGAVAWCMAAAAHTSQQQALPVVLDAEPCTSSCSNSSMESSYLQGPNGYTRLHQLLQADTHLVPSSVDAASLHHPASRQWHLDTHLSASASFRLARDSPTQPGRYPYDHLQEQADTREPSCSPQQENQASEGQHEVPGWQPIRPASSAQRQHANVLGDVSNTVLLNARIEQPVKPKQAPALQIPAVAQEQDCLEGMERTPDEVPTETPESECGQELQQADTQLRDWYHRTMAGICGDLFSRAETLGLESNLQAQRHGQQKLHSTLVAAFTGKAVQQMWGAEWISFRNGAADDEAILQRLSNADLAPVNALLEACILVPLQERAARSTRALMQQLMGAWGLQQHLSALWMTSFLASPALQPFLSAVHAVVRGARRDSAPLGALDLQRSLDACLAEAQEGTLLPSSCLTVRANTAESEGGGITSLQGVSLRLAPPWPLTLVVQDAQLQRYNAIFAVLLQVHVGYKALNRIHSSTRRDIGPSPAGCLAVRMRHFLSTYLSFLMAHLEYTHAAQLQQAVARANSLEDVIAAHEVFLEGASRTAFTAPQQTSKLLRTAVSRLLSLIGEFAVSGLSSKEGGQPDSQAQAEELSGLWEAWQDRFAFFQRLLKGCAARANPALGLSELAASIMPASE